MDNDEGSAYNLSKTTLAFEDPTLERQFLGLYRSQMLGIGRLALITGFALYAVFGLLDAVIVPEVKEITWFIRYAIVCPYLAVVFGLSFRPSMQRYFQRLVASAVVLAGLGIIVMITITDPPGSYLYNAGLLLVMMYGYTFVRLRFVHAMVACWTVTLLYGVTLFAVHPIPFAILLSNAFFLLSANVIGMIVCYQLERHSRQEFVLNQRLEQLAIHDALTGLFNRRYLDLQLRELFTAFRRYQTPFTAVLVDLDDFKSVNDEFGHSTGDKVLHQVAQVLHSKVRGPDIVCRYGGDEFVVLMPKTQAAGAQRLIRRLNGALQDVGVPEMSGNNRLGFSAGVCEMTPEIASPSDLLKNASRALRQAKRQGKDGTVSAGASPRRTDRSQRQAEQE